MGYNDLIIRKRITFLGHLFHRWNLCGAYAIRPYRVTRKCGAFSISIMYPASFPGLGRGLDFLLPSFLVSRQEKKVEAWGIRPTERHSKNGECTKRVNFSGYNNHITPKRAIFSGYSFHKWNVFGAYAIRPYLVTQKRIDFSGPRVGAYCIRPTEHHFNDGGCRKRDTFLGYKDLITPKRSTFWAFIFNGL